MRPCLISFHLSYLFRPNKDLRSVEGRRSSYHSYPLSPHAMAAVDPGAQKKRKDVPKLRRTHSGGGVELDLTNLMGSEDLLIAVISYLDRPSIDVLASCSKCIYSLINNSEILWEQLWKSRYGDCWNILEAVRRRRLIGWNPSENWGPPIQGWRNFMDDFEFGWADWILAGCNTLDCCFVALEGNICDITEFVIKHPGSPESLLIEAGRDVTDTFFEIGHSDLAREISRDYTIATSCAPFRRGRTARWWSSRQMHLRKESNAVLKIAIQLSDNPGVCFPISKFRGHDIECIHHYCEARSLFDPLAQEWWIWWPCCGLGRSVEREDIERILEIKCSES